MKEDPRPDRRAGVMPAAGPEPTMRVIISGCGRVGAGLAEVLSRAGNDVTIIDITSDAFARLEPDFPGNAVRGDGTDEDVLRRAGAENADWFFGMTEGDNRNVLTAQLAAESLGVANVVAKVNDPVRAEAYRALGIATICRTTMMVDALVQFAGLPHDPSVVGVSGATGHHPGGQHHEAAADGTGRREDDPGSEQTGDATATATTTANASANAKANATATPTDGAAGPEAVKASTGPADAAATSARRPAGVRVRGSQRPESEGSADGRGRRSWKLLRRSGERGSEG
jgi:trk system potassium uptake protein TrkA